jgi:hypothetical protein
VFSITIAVPLHSLPANSLIENVVVNIKGLPLFGVNDDQRDPKIQNRNGEMQRVTKRTCWIIADQCPKNLFHAVQC